MPYPKPSKARLDAVAESFPQESADPDSVDPSIDLSAERFGSISPNVTRIPLVRAKAPHLLVATKAEDQRASQTHSRFSADAMIKGSTPMIKTERLIMIPVTPELKSALQISRATFAEMLGVSLPEGWPQFPAAFKPRDIEPAEPWCGYVFIETRTRRLVGSGGFIFVPDKDGDVEIRYEVAPVYCNNGYGTEAVEGLINLATKKRARFVFAKTIAGENAGASVARKAGMEIVDDDFDPALGVLWRFRITCDPERLPLGHVSLRMSG